jgi:hypothetical protein
MKKLAIAVPAILLVYLAFYFYAFQNNDLRGWWKSSNDGKTYLVIDDPDGGAPTSRFVLDGRPWPHAFGERGEIVAGCHDLDEIEFCVKQGVEYHFDYWGP